MDRSVASRDGLIVIDGIPIDSQESPVERMAPPPKAGGTKTPTYPASLQAKPITVRLPPGAMGKIRN